MQNPDSIAGRLSFACCDTVKRGFELLAYRRAALCIAEKTEALDRHCLIIVFGRARMMVFRGETKNQPGARPG